MPSVQLKSLDGRCFDARPDRVDLRDREYQPKLVSLDDSCPDPAFIKKHLPAYVEQGLVLDQGTEGACTGFGLAACINYLSWTRAVNRGDRKPVALVSPRMLYQMARIYDEWPGEDYDGSSCRGAMKGWHKHGVCSWKSWPYDLSGWKDPADDYLVDAAARPLGAYYRVVKDSIADVQSAIREVGAAYVSANVHSGWSKLSDDPLPVIGDRRLVAKTVTDPKTGKKTTARVPEPLGGHAFALVGYTPDGFIVQNSWGTGWGYRGFAVLPYEQWAEFGVDAWVAVLGAPTRVSAREDGAPRGKGKSSRSRLSSLSLRESDPFSGWFTRSTTNTDDRAGLMSDWFRRRTGAAGTQPYRNPAVEPYTESVAYKLSLVLGNNGRPINQFLHAQDIDAAVRMVAHDFPLDWFSRRTGPARLLVYAHGGLNSEAASIKRVRAMAPYFFENGIYPLFLVWKTGVWESITGALEDAWVDLFGTRRVEGLGDMLGEARDYTIERACEHLGVRAIWAEMKQNAEGAGDADGGIGLFTKHLSALQGKLGGSLEVHIVGHSAGSILLGHLLEAWRTDGAGLRATTGTLWAPACTVDFAGRCYVPAIKAGTLNGLVVEAMDNERELADTTGPYGKSLLYLVSRALERAHKTPLLGMERAWSPVSGSDTWNDALQDSMKRTIAALTAGKTRTIFHTRAREMVSTGRSKIRLAHGSFDNDAEVVGRLISRVRGGGGLDAEIENLEGY